MPNTGKLTVIVLEAKNLKKMDVGGLSGMKKGQQRPLSYMDKVSSGLLGMEEVKRDPQV